MPKFCELVPSKSEPERAIEFDRDERELVIASRKRWTRFHVREIACGATRGVELTRLAGDGVAPKYRVYVGGKGERQCDCDGFGWSKDGRCRHTDAVVCLIANEQL